MEKPTSKVIQISATSSHVIFLCEDGSSWSYDPKDNEWQCILDRSAQLQRAALNNNNEE